MTKPLTSIALMMLVEGLANMAYPPPRVNLNDPNAPAALPLANQLSPVFAWFVATLVGGWIADRFLGPCPSIPTSWTPLAQRGYPFEQVNGGRPDDEDVWQFTSFLVQ